MHWLHTVAAAALTLDSCTRLASAAPPCSQVIEGCLGILDGEGAPGDSVHLLASHRSPSPPREPASTAERLQRLPGQVRKPWGRVVGLQLGFGRGVAVGCS